MDASPSGHAREGADREGGQSAYGRGDGREDRAGGRNCIQACEVFHDGLGTHCLGRARRGDDRVSGTEGNSIY